MPVKFKYKRGPAHTRITVFIAAARYETFARCGELVMRNDEFEAWKQNKITLIWEEQNNG